MATRRRKKRSSRSSTWVDFAAVKEAGSIEQVLELYDIPTQKKGDDKRVGQCPFYEHAGTSFPFTVSISKNAWYCHACGTGGNVIDLVVEMKECSAKAAAETLAKVFSVPATKKMEKSRRQRRSAENTMDTVKPAENEALSAFVSDDLDQGQGVATPNPPLKLELKLEREHPDLPAFPQELLEHFEAGYCHRGLMAHRIAVPVHDMNGIRVAYAGYSETDDPFGWKYPENFRRELELYNVHRAFEAPEQLTDGFVVVDDIFAVWSLWLAGVKNVVALMATTTSSEQLDALALAVGESGRVMLSQTVDRPTIARGLRERGLEPEFAFYPELRAQVA